MSFALFVAKKFLNIVFSRKAAKHAKENDKKIVLKILAS